MAFQHMQPASGQAGPVDPWSERAPSRRRLERFANGFGHFLLGSWATLVTIILGLLVAAALSIPFLSYFGLDAIAKPLFFLLHLVCAQVPSHSFFIFGHQLGLCARNLSIYTSMFLCSLAFVLSKKRLPGLPWWLWLLLILPMAWDGITQMFGLRESNWELRLLTGTLFGLANVWFVMPMIQKTLDSTPGLQPQATPAAYYPLPPQTMTAAATSEQETR
jgi:uncharacterized membrane protein